MIGVSPLNVSFLQDAIQDCNINFLIGSGSSAPYLQTLGNIEALLTQLSEQKGLAEGVEEIIKAAIYKRFFDNVIAKNLAILDGSDANATGLIEQYSLFFQKLNSILHRRKTNILSKQINVFTTNIDICIEKSLEDCQLEFNDGFSGRFKPAFNLSNYKKSLYKTSTHFENKSEIPIFNVLKLHGSLTWVLDNEKIRFSDMSHIGNVAKLNYAPQVVIDEQTDVQTLSTTPLDCLAMCTEDEKKEFIQTASNFSDEYSKFPIINPTKDKFRDTVLNETYYEMLRMYSNELEKENTLLFVMGFSFNDEHIRNITLRVANANPTLHILIICRTTASAHKIRKTFSKDVINNNNITCITPVQTLSGGAGTPMKDSYELDLKGVTEFLLSSLLGNLNEK